MSQPPFLFKTAMIINLLLVLLEFGLLFQPRQAQAQVMGTQVGEAAGNLHVQFSQLGLACDEHRQDFINCADSELCQKWVNNAVITCADSNTLQAALVGNPEVFDNFQDRLGGQGQFTQEIQTTSSFALDNNKTALLPENLQKISNQWSYFNARRLANTTITGNREATASAQEVCGPDSNLITDFHCGNFKDKTYWPQAQIEEIVNLCRNEVLPAIENSDYAANELYCRNCNPVYEGGPTDCDVCRQLRQDYPDVWTLSGDYLTTWAQIPTETEDENGINLVQQLLAITETKVKVRAYMVIAKDQSLNERCERILGTFINPFCWIATQVNPQLAQTPQNTIAIIPFWLEGVRGAFRGAQRLYQSLSLPQQSDQLWQDIADSQDSVTPECPPQDSCVITTEACETAAREADRDTSDSLSSDLVKRLVARICSGPQNTCESNVCVNCEFSGATSQAQAERPASFLFNFFLMFNNGIPLKDQSTVQGWVIADRSTLYLKEYGEAIWAGFRFPNEIGLDAAAPTNSLTASTNPNVLGLNVVERIDIPAQHSIDVTNERVQTDTVTREVEVDCPEGQSPPCYENQQARIEYAGPELKYETEGGVPMEWEQQNRGKALVPPGNFPGWDPHRYHCPESTPAPLWADTWKLLISVLGGEPPAEDCSSNSSN
jgi:hypothetical protein